MKLIIPGDPISQARMRLFNIRGMSRVYDPREKEKTKIKKFIKDVYTHDLCKHPRVSFIFHMPIPKSTPKKFLPYYNSGIVKHEKKPDTDNLIKLYLDCMNGITFDDDSKVMLGPAVKLYHPYPKTIVILNETTEILSPQEVDPMTWFALFGEESGKCSCVEMTSLRDSYTPHHLEPAQSDGNLSLYQKVHTSEQVPTVLEILAKANPASKPSSCPAR